ncbi:MAG: SpoIIIAC/SpoIIIAD family protein [Clostridiales bacterium]|nr:SpoIIIAC/SpoIIIAD family protein [Clostridiales bacterium]
MNILAIVGIGIVATAICILIKQYRPEFAMMVSLSCGVLIFVMILLHLSPAILDIQELMSKASLDNGYFKVLVKSLGICYVTSIASDSCKDAGQAAIAGKIELAAKVAIVILALPLFTQIVNYALDLIAV